MSDYGGLEGCLGVEVFGFRIHVLKFLVLGYMYYPPPEDFIFPQNLEGCHCTSLLRTDVSKPLRRCARRLILQLTGNPPIA